MFDNYFSTVYELFTFSRAFRVSEKLNGKPNLAVAKLVKIEPEIPKRRDNLQNSMRPNELSWQKETVIFVDFKSSKQKKIMQKRPAVFEEL